MHLRTRWTLSLAAIALLGILAGCGGGGGGGTSSGDGSPLPAKTLNWVAPESYTDGTPLSPLRDLAVYEIYVNTSGSFDETDSPSAIVSAMDPTTLTPTTSFNLANLDLSRGIVYHVSMRAVVLVGAKSGFSPSASFSF